MIVQKIQKPWSLQKIRHKKFTILNENNIYTEFYSQWNSITSYNQIILKNCKCPNKYNQIIKNEKLSEDVFWSTLNDQTTISLWVFPRIQVKILVKPKASGESKVLN